MNAKWWRDGAAVMLCAMLVAGCASAPARADAQYSQVATPPATVSAPPPASESRSERPPDAQAAFLEGYRAYLAHDNSRAIDRLKFAADNFPALGDYALYYLALAQHDQSDLSGSTETLERLDRTYSESVMLDRADLQL